MKIGIFDSGIGGFSILKELNKLRDDLEVFYYADDAHSPYGEKPESYVSKRCHEIVDEFIDIGCSAVIVACNTATAWSIKELRATYEIPFVGVEPYINVLNQNNWNESYSACVITTTLTGKSQKFIALKSKLDPDNEIDHFASKNLAKIIEGHYQDKNINILEKLVSKELSLLGDHYTHLILGCTHYPLISETIEKVTGKKCISPCPYVAKRASEVIGDRKTEENFEEFYFFSSLSPKSSWQKRNFSSIF